MDNIFDKISMFLYVLNTFYESYFSVNYLYNNKIIKIFYLLYYLEVFTILLDFIIFNTMNYIRVNKIIVQSIVDFFNYIF